MRTSAISFFVFLMICLAGCERSKDTIIGLWHVEEVVVDGEASTPISKWVRFYEDHRQESGNGWVQHSYGNWEVDQDKQMITISNLNGLKDQYGPYSLNFEQDKMTWTRVEDGKKVVVTLNRIESVMASPGDNLLGVWKRSGTSVTKEGTVVNPLDSVHHYLHLRWDHVFEEHNQYGVQSSGIYRIHGHRPLMEMVYYDQDSIFRWHFDLSKDRLTLRSKTRGSKEKIRQYLRVHHLPNQ
jgi:hypothetical protein